MASFEPPQRLRVLRLAKGAKAAPDDLTDRPPARLSPRQLACLHRVALGESSGEIAAALRLSVRTVDQYVAQACARLGVRKRASAVAIALRLQLINHAPSES